MIYVVANTERDARNLATRNGFEDWRQATTVTDLTGVEPGSYVFIAKDWMETPLQVMNEAGEVAFEWPLTVKIAELRTSGVTVEYL